MRKEENNEPELRQARLARNKTASLDAKRIWDDDMDDDSLGAVVDVAAMKRRRLERELAEVTEDQVLGHDEDLEDGDEEDSMLGSDDDEEEVSDEDEAAASARLEKMRSRRGERDDSLAPSLAPSIAPSTTSTSFDLTPESLLKKFPTLFSEEPLPFPKILVTTSLDATIHKEAQDIAALFPNSSYIPRTSHHRGYKYSVREIAKFAANRDYTALIVIREDLKRPTALTLVHLTPGAPAGPTLTYTINKYLPGKKIPFHGNPTNHYPELILNNFKTPLGLLVAKSLHTMFPPQPELGGRQVVTMHNQRDYIFVRRHRYVFRDRRQTEKTVQTADGKEIPGMADIKAGLQEIGPQLTLKLRRVDKGVGRAGSEGEALHEWKGKMEKKRTRFYL
ncbi:Brix-domain-containing protein [Thozetella sp. PMI_491]|nr:Brix-domain-containing protein [Thozetella sp. PMI_491]